MFYTTMFGMTLPTAGFVGDNVITSNGYGAFNYGVEDWGDARSTSGIQFDTKSFFFC